MSGEEKKLAFIRRHFRLPTEPWDIASAAVLALAFIIISLTFRDYGYAWDEARYQNHYGRMVLDFYKTLGEDKSALYSGNLYLYGGFFDGLRELFVSALPFKPRYVRHFINAMAGFLCLAGVRYTARLAYSPAAGFWATLILVACPPFWGHIFINPKDIPFAAGYIWTVYWLIRFERSLNKPSLPVKAMLTISLAMTLGVRIGGCLLVFYMALVCALKALSVEPGKRVGILASFLSISAGAYAMMLAFWPAALLNPISIPWEAFIAANKFKYADWVLFNGKYIMSTEVPRTYLPVVFGVGLPEAMLAAVLAGLLYGVAFMWKKEWNADSGRSWGIAILLTAALFPPLWAIVVKATLYDNTRHFLFILPPLSCLAGIALAYMAGRAMRWRGFAGPAFTVIAAAALLYPVIPMARLHPYQYVYINSLGGGMPEGESRFDTDYWLTSYREAVDFAADHAEETAKKAGLPLREKMFSVVPMGCEDVLAGDMPRIFRLIPESANMDGSYVIVTERWAKMWNLAGYTEIGRIRRLGMTFTRVFANDNLLNTRSQ